MDELKTLLSLVKDLPNAALVVLGGYLAYRLAVIGSIYATIRFLAERALEAYKVKKNAPVCTSLTDIRVVNNQVAVDLKTQLERLVKASHGYLHSSDVQLLAKLLDKHFEGKEK
jgi:hypothetical protein